MRITEKELREMCLQASSQLDKDAAEFTTRNGKHLRVRTGLKAGIDIAES